MGDIDACWFCVTGLHNECIDMSLSTHPDTEDIIRWSCCCERAISIPTEEVEKLGVGRPVLDPDDVTDPLSTGRKRAKLAAPIFSGMLCEWAGLKFAGGGIEPIMGCRGNQIAEGRSNIDLPEGMLRGERHHGPDKNVLNNSVGINLHRVCSVCHKRFHAQNDKYYPARGEAGKQMLPDPEFGEVHGHDPVTLWEPEEYAEWLLAHGYK